MVRLSVLDQSQIGEGRTARDALDETTALAQAAERFGYTRFWVSEHRGLELGQELRELPSVATAEDYPYTEFDLYRIQTGRQRRFVGTPERVKAELLAAGERYGTDEFMVVTPVYDQAARIRSYEQLAEAFGVKP